MTSLWTPDPVVFIRAGYVKNREEKQIVLHVTLTSH